MNVQLKSIEIIGFKSFADKTLIKFPGGMTGIVGPNGSGKSNIAESIRWVMGNNLPKISVGRGCLMLFFQAPPIDGL